MAGQMEDMQRAQIELIKTLHSDLGLTPRDEPLDLRAHARLVDARKVGAVTREDYKRFPLTTQKTQAPEISLVTLLDASPSMKPYIQEVIGMGCAVNEAAQIANSRVGSKGLQFHMNTWGSRPAITIAQPGDSPQDIARRITGIDKGANFRRSDLAPSLEEYLEKAIIALRQPPARNVGMTEIVIMTDGDVTDYAKALPALKALLANAPRVSVSFVCVDQGYHRDYDMVGKTQADALVKELKTITSSSRGNRPVAERVSVCHVPFIQNAWDDGPDLEKMRPMVETKMQEVMTSAIARGRGEIAIPSSEYARQLSNALIELRGA